MRKGGGSCLKILGCAGDPAEHEDLEPLEGKASLSRRRWSFRKRSDRRQLLSNDVVTEHPPLTVNAKEKNHEVDAKCYTHPTDPPSLPAKIPVVKFVEETSFIPPAILDPEVSDTLPISKSKTDGSDSHIDEYDVVATQTVIRGHLARKELEKHKNIVKLQAVVRGHLVRRQAVGTLRCVQAIVKMQTLVRARRRIRRKADKEGMVKDISNIKQYELHSSTEKLLANAFARLLLEKSPSKKSKVIHITCDPSRSESSWKWLERWMTVTSSDVTPQHQERLDPSTILSEVQTEEQGTHCEMIETDAVITKNLQIISASLPTKEKWNKDNKIEADSLSLDSCADLGESKVSDLNEFQGPLSCSEGFGSPLINEQEEVANMDITNATCDSNLKQICAESDTQLHSEPLNERHTVDLEKSRRTTKRMGEPRENESTNIGFGLRVVSGIQAFSAVPSKFDKLNANLKSGNMSSSSNQESKEVLKPEIITQSDCSTKPMFKFADYSDQGTAEEQKSGILAPRSDSSLSHKMQIQTLGSECGTEISISSTLDSPDGSEADDGGEIILEIGSLEKRDYSTDLVGHCVSEILHQEPKSVETDVRDHGDHISAIANSENVKQTLSDQSQSKPDVPAKLEKATDQQAHKSSSPEGSPRSHITAPESHEAPASQISSDAKRTPENQAPISSSPEGFPLPHITEPESQGTPVSQVSSNSNTKTKKCTASGSLSSKKRTTRLAGKNSPANKNMETGVLSPPEHLPKNPTKTSKRRNSLGSGKTEHDGDLEPRFSSSNSIPSYMQVTESAWAKVHAAASNSPKASPDGHGKESSYAKKRLSLPMGNGKPTSSVSPRIQPNSQTDGTCSPHTYAERRKWQR